ncbi:MAG: endo alpha-1,4 polygalactosaminidase, partial [Pseudomonadota bacterium]
VLVTGVQASAVNMQMQGSTLVMQVAGSGTLQIDDFTGAGAIETIEFDTGEVFDLQAWSTGGTTAPISLSGSTVHQIEARQAAFGDRIWTLENNALFTQHLSELDNELQIIATSSQFNEEYVMSYKDKRSIFGGHFTKYRLERDLSVNGTDQANHIVGSWWGEQIQGLAGSDLLFGNGGGDDLYGGEGDDELYGGDSGDRLEGGTGEDLLFGDGQNDILIGDAGDDELHGGSGDDELLGDRWDTEDGPGPTGNDTIFGGAGSDTLQGGHGRDILDGGSGSDTLVGGSGNDTMLGGVGIDTFWADDGDDVVDGGDGADKIYGGDGDDLLKGGAGEDLITGDPGNDQILGDAGDDSAYGGAGDDHIAGGIGNDFLLGDDGHDIIIGGEGHDSAFGYTGNDTLRGSAGNDALAGEGGSDEIHGDDGDDIIFGDHNTDVGEDRLFGGAGADLIRGGGAADAIRGGAGNDDLYGDDGDDVVDGDEGDDRLFGGAGHNSLGGGDGDDILKAGENADTLDGGHGDDLLFGLLGDDISRGGAGQDRLFGDEGRDVLYGDAGDDQISGWSDDDQLYGGDGNDSLFGEDGDDTVNGGEGQDILFGDRQPDPVRTGPSVDDVIAQAQGNLGYGSYALIYKGPEYNAVALSAFAADMVIMGAGKYSDTNAPNSEVMWTPGEISQIKQDGKLLVGYFNVASVNSFTSEALWDSLWTTTGLADGALNNAPTWLGDIDPAFPQTRAIDFLQDTSGAWLERAKERLRELIDQSFDGVFLDDVLKYYEFYSHDTHLTSQAAQAMRDFIVDLTTYAQSYFEHARGAGNDFHVIVNGAPYIVDDANFFSTDDTLTPEDVAYFDAIDAILVENYVRDGHDVFLNQTLNEFGARGVGLLSLDSDVISSRERLEAQKTAVDYGFLPYVSSTEDYASLDAPITADFGDVPVSSQIGDDVLYGGDADDTLFGGLGDDSLSGDGGNDHIDGGGGFDETRFSGDFANYVISAGGAMIEVVDRTGVDGTDTLHNVERLEFTDGIYDIATEEFTAFSELYPNAPRIMLPEGHVPFDPIRQFISTASHGAVTSIAAEDDDLSNGDRFQFKLFGEDADNFSINSATGAIALIDPLTDPYGSFDGDSIYEVIIFIEDQAGFTDAVEMDYMLFVGG